MLSTTSIRTFFRYILVGGGLFLIDLSIFMLSAAYLNIDPMTSQLTSRATGATIGFIAHKKITFRKKGGKQQFSIAKQGTGYTAIALFTYFSSPFVLMQFLLWTHGNKVIAKILTEAILVMITFFSMKYIFRPTREY